MDEVLKVDGNFKPVTGFVTDDASQLIRMGRIDDTTKGLKVMIVGGAGSGTVTSITQGTGILLSPSPITTTGSVSLATAIQPIATLGSANQSIRVNAGATALEYYTPAAGGITIGTTTITSGTNTRILYDNSGVVGEYTLTGSGTVVVMQTSPTFLGTVVIPTPFTLGATSVTSTGTQLNYLSGASGTTGTNTTNIVFSTSPTLITPVLGVATATSLNGLIITTTTGTFTLTNGKTLAVTNTLTLSGTDSTVMTFPSTTATIARTDAAQTFTGVQTTTQVLSTNNAIAASGNAATVPVTSKTNTVTNNSAATLTITLTTSGAIDRQMVVVCVLDASAVAQTITWVNTENSTVGAPTTSNGSTTLPLTVGFQYNNATSKWRCIAVA